MEAVEPMRMLIAGGSGQVGSELQPLARKAGWAVAAPPSAELDIADARSVAAAFREHRPDLVVNCAAYTAVDAAEDDCARAFAVNRDGVARLAEACGEADVPLFHLSTDYVFNGLGDGAYTEAEPVSPLGVYGLSKWQGERALAGRLARHLTLRVSWVFGARGGNFVKTILGLACRRDRLAVVDDQHGCPTPAAAIAAALVALADRYRAAGELPWGLYHYAGRPTASWYDLARQALDLAEAEWGMTMPPVEPVDSGHFPAVAFRPPDSTLDSTHFERTFGIAAPAWEPALRAMLQQWRPPEAAAARSPGDEA